MKKLAALLLVALAATALVACGSSDDDTTESATVTTEETTGGSAGGGETGGGEEAGGGETALVIEADPGTALAYTSDTASTKAGKVDVTFDNPQQLTHDVAFEDSGGKEVGKTDLIADSTADTAIEFKAGEYTFYCTVPGHREAGMEGTLTVE